MKVAQLVGLLLACLVLFSIDWRAPWRDLSGRARGIIVSLNAMAVAFLIIRLVRIVSSPKEWDFLSYFLWSRLVGSGLPVYSPESSHSVLATLNIPLSPSAEFIREIVDVGPTNPPTTLLWVRFWLADLPFETAHILWLLLSLVFLVLCCYLLSRSVGGHWTTTLLIFPIIAISPVTGAILRYGQTTFVVMAAILAAWISLARVSSGVWLGLGSLIKPFGSLLGLYFVVRRRWKEVLVAAVIGVGALLVSGLVFGFGEVASYLSGEVTARSPAWVFTEPVNQSLMAVALRIFDPEVAQGKTLTQPVFLIVAALLTTVTVILGWLAEESQDRLVFSLVLSLALLIFPGSLVHYCFFLILPWFHLTSIGRGRGLPAFLLAAGLCGGIVLISLSAFSATLITWTILAAMLSAGNSKFSRIKKGTS